VKISRLISGTTTKKQSYPQDRACFKISKSFRQLVLLCLDYPKSLHDKAVLTGLC